MAFITTILMIMWEAIPCDRFEICAETLVNVHIQYLRFEAD